MPNVGGITYDFKVKGLSNASKATINLQKRFATLDARIAKQQKNWQAYMVATTRKIKLEAEAFGKLATAEAKASYQAKKLAYETQKVAHWSKKGTYFADRLTSSFKRMALGLSGAYLGFHGIRKIVGGLASSVTSGATFEAMRYRIEKVTKSQEKANYMFQEFKTMSTDLGITVESLMGSYISLTARGLDPNIRQMKLLSALSKTVGYDMSLIALALSQIKSKGYAAAEEINRQLGQVVPIVKWLAEELNITTAEVFDKMKAKAIDAQTFFTVFWTRLEKEYGDFWQGYSQATEAKLARVHRQWELFLVDLGTNLLPVVNVQLNEMINYMTENKGEIQELARGMATIVESLIKTVVWGLRAVQGYAKAYEYIMSIMGEKGGLEVMHGIGGERKHKIRKPIPKPLPQHYQVKPIPKPTTTAPLGVPTPDEKKSKRKPWQATWGIDQQLALQLRLRQERQVFEISEEEWMKQWKARQDEKIRMLHEEGNTVEALQHTWAMYSDTISTYAQTATQAWTDMFYQLGQSSKSMWDIYKALAIAQTIVSGIQLAWEGAKALAGIPYVGPALATAWIATIGAQTAVQVKMIESQRPQGYAQGGIIYGSLVAMDRDRAKSASYASGGIIKNHQYAELGEGGKRELVIPEQNISDNYVSGYTRRQGGDGINIINAITPDQIALALHKTPAGKNTVLNFVLSDMDQKKATYRKVRGIRR